MLKLIQPDWSAPAVVRAFTTTRTGGLSRDPWGGPDFGGSGGDDTCRVDQNRKLLRGYLPSEPYWLKQVHGSRVVNYEESSTRPIEADAVISTEVGQVCAILTADCLPVLLCNKSGRQVAAVHAGWRGLAAGVLEAAVTAMDGYPEELLAWLGPAIGPQVYTVGQDVVDRFRAVSEENSSAFVRRGERWLADLYQLARLALSRVGVSQVSGGQYCTYSEPEKFFSYRRDGVTGRMASVIWLAEK